MNWAGYVACLMPVIYPVMRSFSLVSTLKQQTRWRTHQKRGPEPAPLPVTDLFFRSLFAFFIFDLHSRKVIHVGVTRSPTDA